MQGYLYGRGIGSSDGNVVRIQNDELRLVIVFFAKEQAHDWCSRIEGRSAACNASVLIRHVDNGELLVAEKRAFVRENTHRSAYLFFSRDRDFVRESIHQQTTSTRTNNIPGAQRLWCAPMEDLRRPCSWSVLVLRKLPTGLLLDSYRDSCQNKSTTVVVLHNENKNR